MATLERLDRASAKKAAGVKLGRPRQLPAAVVERIVGARAAGGTLAGIARELTAEGVPAAQGKAVVCLDGGSSPAQC
jgi:hypothetical protein